MRRLTALILCLSALVAAVGWPDRAPQVGWPDRVVAVGWPDRAPQVGWPDRSAV